MKGLSRALLIGAVLVVGAGLGAWRMGTASGNQATLSLTGAPASVSVGASFTVQVTVAGVTNTDGLGAYEWHLDYDPNIIEYEGVVNGDPNAPPPTFLGGAARAIGDCFTTTYLDTGRVPEAAGVRFACGTAGLAVKDGGPQGAKGSGVLSTVTFTAKAQGSSNLLFDARPTSSQPGGIPVPLSDTAADDIPSGYSGTYIDPPGYISGSVTVTSGTPGPAATSTPAAGDTATPAPGDTPTPGGPTATPGGPTATPGGPTATPAGPTATPTPLPPGFEAVDLAAGCNPVATTYADATPIGTIAAAVGPAGNLEALWELAGAAWQGYSPAYAEASDLTASNLLDVVFVCVTGPGAFVRPIV